MKRNCWEIMKCGRGLNGTIVDSRGVCPAATEKKLDGEHGGKNAGRSCWIITGTLCNNRIQGFIDHKLTSCTKCKVYNTVRQEEYPYYVLPRVLLGLLESSK